MELVHDLSKKRLRHRQRGNALDPQDEQEAVGTLRRTVTGCSRVLPCVCMFLNLASWKKHTFNDEHFLPLMLQAVGSGPWWRWRRPQWCHLCSYCWVWDGVPPCCPCCCCCRCRCWCWCRFCWWRRRGRSCCCLCQRQKPPRRLWRRWRARPLSARRRRRRSFRSWQGSRSRHCENRVRESMVKVVYTLSGVMIIFISFHERVV